MAKGDATIGVEAWGAPRRAVCPLRRVLLGGASAVLLVAVAACATPEPLTGEQIEARVAADEASLAAEQEPATGPITLEEALARALKHNLDHRLKAMETALAQGEADLAHWDLLPRVTTTAGYTARDKESASSSRSLQTGTVSLEPSTSSDNGYETASLSMVWNVLDFGVTYLRAKQQTDRALIAEERRRKVVQTFVQDVRYVFWKTVSAQRLLPRVEALRTQTQAALEDSRAVQGQGLQPPAQALEYQMSLLETLRQIGTLQRDLVLAKTELGTLMGLSPGTPFEVVQPEGEPEIPRIPDSLGALQRVALINRPELREEDYNERIGVAETRKALLRLLPSLEMNADLQYSGNSFLVNQAWMEGGLKVSWNLINLASGPQNIRLSESREELVRKRRLALGMAVLTQVNVAWIRYQQAHQDYALAKELHAVAAQLQAQAETAQTAGGETGAEAVRRTSRAVFMELQRDTAYADLQNAVGRLFVSSGTDPLPETVSATDLPTLAAEIGRTLKTWEEGPRPGTPDESRPVSPDGEPAPASAGNAGEGEASGGTAGGLPSDSAAVTPVTAVGVSPVADVGPVAPAPGGAESANAVRIHLASFRTAAAAERAWARMADQHKDILAGVGHTIVPADLGAHGSWSRVMAGPFATAKEARGLCDVLIQRKVHCLVIGRKSPMFSALTDVR